MIVEKIRFRFRKAGALRLVSHHDLMRCFERMLRRAEIPVLATQGFHPKPRLVFALSLPLGIVGCQEVVEMAMERPMDPAEVQRQLSQHAPPGLEFLSAEAISPRITAQVCTAGYRIRLDQGRAEAATERGAELLAAADCWVERQRPAPRKINIRPYLRSIRVTPKTPSPPTPLPRSGGEGGPEPLTPVVGERGWGVEFTPEPRASAAECYLEIYIEVTPTGTARPDEVFKLLGLADLLHDGAIIERFLLELHAEAPPPQDIVPEPALAMSDAT